jgi:hypothetical protein
MVTAFWIACRSNRWIVADDPPVSNEGILLHISDRPHVPLDPKNGFIPLLHFDSTDDEIIEHHILAHPIYLAPPFLPCEALGKPPSPEKHITLNGYGFQI